ncbi:hypothetical protein ACH4PW_11185 [Streptomyces sp. NPDC017082]|uniref:hypothetical protein n=1 Tax=Streptomyces sp. NPDC017082 TaxID=3364974 RepID=UPI0037BAE67A
MPGTVLLLAAAPLGRNRLVDAGGVLPVLAAVAPAVLSGTDTANIVELADPVQPQAVLTRLRAAAAAPGPLTVYLTGQLHLDRRQHQPHLALARTTPATLRYTALPWQWIREELRLRSAADTALVVDLHADAEAWRYIGERGLDCGPHTAVYGRVAPPAGRRGLAEPAYMKTVATLLRSGHRPRLDILHGQALARITEETHGDLLLAHTGGPMTGAPVVGGLVAGSPVTGGPVPGVPVAGSPVPGVPLAGGPVAGVTTADGSVAGVPVAGVPAQGGPPGDGPLRTAPAPHVPAPAGPAPVPTGTPADAPTPGPRTPEPAGAPAAGPRTPEPPALAAGPRTAESRASAPGPRTSESPAPAAGPRTPEFRAPAPGPRAAVEDPHALISAAVRGGRHGEADGIAARHEEEAVRAHGAASEQALHWREVRADLAMFAGDPVASCRAWLALAEDRLAAGQAVDAPAVESAVDRAHHQWARIEDTARARELGPALAELRHRVPGRRHGALEDIRRQLVRLEAAR